MGIWNGIEIGSSQRGIVTARPQIEKIESGSPAPWPEIGLTVFQESGTRPADRCEKAEVCRNRRNRPSPAN